MRRQPEVAVRPLSTSSERVAVVGLVIPRREGAERTLEELAHVVRALLHERRRADQTRHLGCGKVEELTVGCAQSAVDLVVIDAELPPSQGRHLEEAVGRPVVDRTQRIPDIFAQGARTREGTLHRRRIVGAQASAERVAQVH